MVLWDTFLTQVSTAFGIGDVTIAGYIVSLIVMLGFVAVVAITTKSAIGTVMTGYGCLILFVVAGWIDAWVLILTLVGTAGVYALVAKGILS